MKLDNFYSLRASFTIIGITGRVGGGCSEVAKMLSANDFIDHLSESPSDTSDKLEQVKYKICYDYLKFNRNWKEFAVITYKDVLLFHVLYFACNNQNSEQAINSIVDILCQNGHSQPGKEQWKNRFDGEDDKEFMDNVFLPFLKRKENFLSEFSKNFNGTCLNQSLKSDMNMAYALFFGDDFFSFSQEFYKILNKKSIVKRTRFTHDLANNLRANGEVQNQSTATNSLTHIYIIAETINRLIKAWRNEKHEAKIVIDALKNSLELMYFKEKYAAFYMIAVNKDDKERREYLNRTVPLLSPGENIDTCVEELMLLDDNEFKSNDFKAGKFSSPDIENCIQKSDYHIFIDKTKDQQRAYFSLEHQLIKLIALIGQPGIVTPSTEEHFMQVAYNAKFNSGCISRQVGAVVTDENYSIKAIGWNDVAEGQMPCNLRNVNDLISSRNKEVFSDFENGDGGSKSQKFHVFARNVVEKADLGSLNGRNCAFCFKSFYNAFENDKNQVHTRSLHAEENAMLQITKYGGHGIKGGNLYTTASPCELCSKKAFQLGIKKIYYIDPYPGIATTHVLKSGINPKDDPLLIMFQGAVGRAFHKLYEPFMAYKDELSILTNIRPHIHTTAIE